MEVHVDPADPNHRIVDDPFGAYTDLLSFNEYIGWYDGLPDKLPQIRWTFGYAKPVVISEFGADALQGMHADRLTRFSEEFQEDLYRQTLAMLQKMPQWRGTTPWILADFRSPRRPLPNVQDGWNRKGLIGENGTRKKAFYVLKDFYAQVATLALMEKVADWQLAHLEPVESIKVMREETRSPRSWEQAAFYVGLTRSPIAASRRASVKRSSAMAAARTGNWAIASITPTITRSGRAISGPRAHGAGPKRSRHCASASTRSSRRRRRAGLTDRSACFDRWCWCDALFMAPPVWIELTAATGDRATRRIAHAEFKATTDFLYDRDEHLYYRDSRFFEQRDAQRPQAVLEPRQWLGVRRPGARPHVLPKRIRRGRSTKRCSRRWRRSCKTLQKPDGYWAPSLLAPEERRRRRAAPASSSTAWPGASRRACSIARHTNPSCDAAGGALEKAVHADGMLGSVQQVSDRPEQVSPNDTQFYGVGAFLLAGSAVYDLYLNKD